MSRVRSDYGVLSTAKYKCVQNNVTNLCSGDSASYANVITDELLTSSARPLPVHSCVHTKNVSSRVTHWMSSDSQYGSTSFGRNFDIDIVGLSPYGNYDGSDLVDWVSLVTDLADDVRGLNASKSQLAVTFAEFHKTWKMIRNPFQLLKPNWRTLAGLSSAMKLAKRGANLWLEAQYGWRPLWTDMKSFVASSRQFLKTLNQAYSEGASRHLNKRVQYVDTQFDPTVDDSTWNSYVAGFTNDCLCTYTGNGEHLKRFIFGPPRVTACITCNVRDSGVNHVSKLRRGLSNFGLDPERDVLPTLWELVPFSFVVDWFINSRGLMNLPRFNLALGTLRQTGVYGLCYSLKSEYTYRMQLVPAWSYSMYYADWWWNYQIANNTLNTSPVVTGTEGVYSRYERISDLPPCSTSVFLNKGLTLSKLASSLSLIIQRAKG